MRISQRRMGSHTVTVTGVHGEIGVREIGVSEKFGSEQNHHDEKRKLNPAIATRASLIFIGFQALNQPPAQVNHAQAAIKNVAT